MATANLWNHRMRSGLTILGVIIGIGSVLAVVTLGSSFEESIVGQFDSVDQKSIFVTSSLTPVNAGPPNCQTYCNIFTDIDRDALADLPGVERVLVSGDVVSSSLTWKGQELTFERLTATTPDADELRMADEYASGGAFTLGEPELVLGSQVAEFLGRGANVTAGDAVTVRFQDGQTLNATVAGVLKEDTTLFGDRNGRVFVPVDPFYKTLRVSPSSNAEVRVYNGFTVVASDVRDVDGVRDLVDAYVQDDSDASLSKVEDQTLLVATSGDIQAGISSLFDQVTLFIGAIGGVSLVVGAIGIANIMLVSVTERTREIGVMKAIGAKDREILTLFLLEALLIGLAGALLGMSLGIGGGFAIVTSGIVGEDVPFTLPYEWLGISIGVGVGVGLVAGFLPARRATKIQPIQALAYE
ncbi:MAG: ABC transporter permease [Candidatus Thermoplasmatota archaeon]